jgi:hypothetical protein
LKHPVLLYNSRYLSQNNISQVLAFTGRRKDEKYLARETAGLSPEAERKEWKSRFNGAATLILVSRSWIMWGR